MHFALLSLPLSLPFSLPFFFDPYSLTAKRFRLICPLPNRPLCGLPMARGSREFLSSPSGSGRRPAAKRILVHFSSKFPHFVRLKVRSRSLLEKYTERQIPHHHSIFGVDKVIGVSSGPVNLWGDVSSQLSIDWPHGFSFDTWRRRGALSLYPCV